jgi:hypothetical protein
VIDHEGELSAVVLGGGKTLRKQVRCKPTDRAAVVTTTGHGRKLPSRAISDHDDGMGDVHPFPRRGSVFVDARGEQRTMRVACYPDEGIVVISLWAAGVCRASFRLLAALAPEMAELLAACNGKALPGPRVGDLVDSSPPAQAS